MCPVILDKGVLRSRQIIGRQTISPKRNTGITLQNLQRLLETKQPQILIIRSLGGIGDVLMSTPAVKALKHKWPESRVTYATDFKYMNGALKDILQYNPYIDELIPYQAVISKNYDFTADITAVAVGEEKSNNKVQNRIDIFARYIGVDLSQSGHIPTYIVSDEEKLWAQEKLSRYPRRSSSAPRIGIQVRSSTITRNWPLEKFKELAIRLTHELGAQVCIFDSSMGGGEREEWNISGLVPFKDFGIRQVAALINEMDLFICLDSGLLHIAGALNKKIVAIFGPTDPDARINRYPNALAVWKREYMCAPCVVGESLVETGYGYQEIQNIEVGALVRTIGNSLEEVQEIHKNPRNDRQIYELEVFGSNETIACTDDHKFQTFRTLEQSMPELIEAQHLNIGNYLCIPKQKQKSEIEISDYTRDMFWLFGLYTAEGYTVWQKTETSRTYDTRFVISAEEIQTKERLEKIAQTWFGCSLGINDNRPKENTLRLDIHNKFLTKWILELFGEKKAATKSIPQLIFSAPDELIDQFLDGYEGGDGHLDSNGVLVLSTASRSLAYGLQKLYINRFGILGKIYKRIRDTNFKANSTIYRIYISKKNKSKMSHTTWKATDDFILVPIKKIVKTDRSDEFVYDLSVANDPTFTINNLATYDCWYSPTSCNRTFICLDAITVEEVMETVKNHLPTPIRNEISISSMPQFSTENELAKYDYYIFRDGGIGDLINCLPAFAGFKKAHPDKTVALITLHDNMQLMENTKIFDKVLGVLSKQTPIQTSKKFFDARDLFEKNIKNGTYFEDKPRYQAMAEFLGCSFDPTDYKMQPDLEGQEEIRTYLKRLGIILEDEKLVIIQPFATCKTRSWIDVHANKLAEYVHKLNFRPVFIHNNPCYNLDYKDALNLTGRLNTKQLNSLVSISQFAITVDSGCAHLAGVNSIPFIAIMNAIPPKYRFGLYKNWSAIQPELPCSPCWDKQCANVRCMHMTTPEIILAKFKEMINALKI